MERPDLGNEYGGWQAIDATPQETSEDMYRCGPSSLRAVRDGELQRPYDAAYVFAQVNADKVTKIIILNLINLMKLSKSTSAGIF